MYFLIAFLTLTTLISWTLLISILNLKSLPAVIINPPDGTYFCNECNHVVGYRRFGREIINANFVEVKNRIELPPNVILFRSKTSNIAYEENN